MSASVFFGGLVVVVGLVLAVLITPILFIPVALILLLALFTGPLALILHRNAGDHTGPPTETIGTPSTSEATYDPVDRPEGVTPRGG